MEIGMIPIKPLSVKFRPEVRARLKRIAFLLEWPEGQFVNASVAIILELIDDRSLKRVPKTIHMAREALDFEKKTSRTSVQK
jgi:hypothetical protein